MSNRTGRAYVWVAAILRWGSWLSAGVMLLGVLLLLTRPDLPLQMGSALPLHLLATELARGNPYALMQLGVLLLLFTPLTRIVAAAVSFWLEGERRYSLVSLVVLAIILTSLLLGRGDH